ncbi:MAG: ATP phosphoribosyltransferase regulatory subunit [Paracoccaceae bacterium]|nr:ATP phosphoribosyltransferase regulatory subunit [Paracoccaceae bacterium]
MTSKSAIRADAERLRSRFEARGATLFETSVLQPAGALLNLYGEDIRARAFVTHDPLRGEMMLRPDFTLPLVQSHLASGGQSARYTYAGEVFRRQEDDDTRPREYIQVGFEIFGGGIEADAEVFTAMAEALDGAPARATIGDFGVLTSAIQNLNTPQRRKHALLRHIWRPRRFDALLDRFSRPAPPPPPMPDENIVHVGRRLREDIAARIALLAEEAETPPIPFDDLKKLRALEAIDDTAPKAVDALRQLGEIGSADRLAATLEAIAGHGIDPGGLRFQTSFGLTSLEYYSGFVFGFKADGFAPVATGGRYDLLTAALNNGVPVPAVGGVIRPEVRLAMKGAAA